MAEHDWLEPFDAEEREVYARYKRSSAATFPWNQSCLLVVDVTEAFVGPQLPILEATRETRTACGLAAWEALPYLRRLIDTYRSNGCPVAFAKPNWDEEAWAGGTTTGTSRNLKTEIDRIPSMLAPRPSEPIFLKPRASAFFATSLLTYLVRAGVRGLVVVGSTTSGCVRATVVDASSWGFPVVIAADACFDRSSLSHRVALGELSVKYANVMLTADVERSISGMGKYSSGLDPD